MNEKIGLYITTYNSEAYFKKLYESIPFNKIDELVVVNGGDVYTNKYEGDWIQHNKNHYPAFCRNDGIVALMNRKCTHIFGCEDDMIIKNPNIFDKYINASKESNIKYFCFVSTSWGSGTPFKRTPKANIEYKNNVVLSFYPNMCNEFTYFNSEVFDSVGIYDDEFRYIFDIDMVYRISQTNYMSPFWWFPDVYNSDEYIMNNPDSLSRLNSENKRDKHLPAEFEMFKQKHNISLQEIINPDLNILKTKLKVVINGKQQG